MTKPTLSIRVTESQVRDHARDLYSVEVQGSRLDLLQYDHDTTQQEFWFRRVQRQFLTEVNRMESAGQPVRYTYVAA